MEARGVLRGLPPAARRMLTVRTVGLGAALLARLEGPAALGHPAAALVTGLAGGCGPDLRPGDLVIGEPVMRPGAGLDGHPDPALRARAERALEAAGLRYRVGPLLTVDRVVASPREKAGAFAAHGALAVDMESAHVIAWARRAGLPALAVRAVADGPDDEVPPELLRAVGPDGRMRPAAVARCLGRPALIGEAWRLGRRSRRGLESLSRFVRAFVDLPGHP
jgi:nucleoside phosphorylase